MRIRMIAIVGACAVRHLGVWYLRRQAPDSGPLATPIGLSVYVNDSRISVSPSSVGAGPVVFTVTNQATTAEALAISRPGAATAIARTAPINPDGTTQVSVDFRPGVYTIATARGGTRRAALRSSRRSARR